MLFNKLSSECFAAAVCLMVLPLFSATGLLSRFQSFSVLLQHFSIGYEVLFYCALGLTLMAWILFENANLYIKENMLSTSSRDLEESLMKQDIRWLQLSGMRIALTFMVIFNIAFFGTGNFASIASFEISSVYRFITIFSPFLMTALLIFRLLIPFMLVIFQRSRGTGYLKYQFGSHDQLLSSTLELISLS